MPIVCMDANFKERMKFIKIDKFLTCTSIVEREQGS